MTRVGAARSAYAAARFLARLIAVVPPGQAAPARDAGSADPCTRRTEAGQKRVWRTVGQFLEKLMRPEGSGCGLRRGNPNPTWARHYQRRRFFNEHRRLTPRRKCSSVRRGERLLSLLNSEWERVSYSTNVCGHGAALSLGAIWKNDFRSRRDESVIHCLGRCRVRH
jgi:hypothetical protein